MANAVNILNNTLLLPSSDSLVSSHQLADTNIAEKVGSFQKGKDQPLAKDFSIVLKTTDDSGSDSKRTSVTRCQRVSGLSVKRNVDTMYSGGEHVYAVKLPGNLSYGKVTFSHLYTNSKLFLDWMINGVSQGGAMRADIEITIAKVTYTLHDAFPIEWKLGNVSNRTWYLSNDQIPIEEMTVVYGKLDYAKAS